MTASHQQRARPRASADASGRPSVLLTVSGRVPDTLEADVRDGRRPRADYVEIARACHADVIDHDHAPSGGLERLLDRLPGDLRLAIRCFSRRRRYRTVITDGEGVGLLFAALSRLTRRRVRHVMIGHRLSPAKKRWLHRCLGLRRTIDHVIVYSSAQRAVAIDQLAYRPDQVTMMPFMVDTAFWRPEGLVCPQRDRPLICAAGREFRDYATLVEAVRDLDVDVVLAAASPWSRRADGTTELELPGNVSVTALGHFELRQLYAESTAVIVPVLETDFQAGITTILEAMSMSRPVVCTRTAGQSDTVIDEVTGLYVPPADPSALRDAIVRLIGDERLRLDLAAAARAWVCANADIETYAQRFAAICAGLDDGRAGRSD